MLGQFILPPEVQTLFDTVCNDSLIFNEKNDADLPKYNQDELFPGGILGRGGFCNVSEILRIKLFKLKENEEENEGRLHMANNFLRENDARYAIKKMREDLEEDDVLKGIFDLALEAKFLAVIDHPHIIKIRGVASTEYLSKDFFVLLDRLYNTLEAQIDIWYDMDKKNKSVKNKLIDRKGKKKRDLLVNKMNVAYDIAAALSYLHKNSIIYRDLSPDNVGFDVRGEVKIFDFGLAKELIPSLKTEDGNYKLTGYTGSLRFMAPEVVLCKPYNESADSFSFGILLWNILSCVTPYKGYSIPMYETLVVERGYRPQDPAVKEDWPKELSKLMQSCWSGNPKERPSLEDSRAMMGNFIMAQSFGQKVELDLDMSMRSKHGSKKKQQAKVAPK